MARYKEFRELLHSGDVLRIDHDDDRSLAHGSLAADRRRALVAFVQLTTAQSLTPRPVRIPELIPDQRYHVRLLARDDTVTQWLTKVPPAIVDGLELTGRQLAAHSVRLPVVAPESIELLLVEAVS